MKLSEIIEEYMLTECKKLGDRYHAYHNALHAENIRNKKRIHNPPPKVVKTPDYWCNRLFNPFYVTRNANSISLSIAKKIKRGQYTPHEPIKEDRPKPGGGTRNICIYEIPDSAISNYIYDTLMNKNRHRFSSFSYAYRQDKNVHYAIQDISVDLKQSDRLFIAEFDFSDFFGSIEHDFLFEQFNKNGFLVADVEQEIIKQFLRHRQRGIPQGTSISLFLANMSCWKMDKAFEGEGIKFARYADDTVLWSTSYDKICLSYEIISNFSKEAGVNINFNKSDGISLLSKPGLPTELANSKHFFDFLGYRLSVEKVSIKSSVVRKIKGHISLILYLNLLHPLKGTILRAVTMPNNDKDYHLTVALQQIRRYLYGNLSESTIYNYMNGRIPKISFKGLMSFYPLVDDEAQLKELDGWLVHAIFMSLKKRLNLLDHHGHGYLAGRFPFNVSKNDMVNVFSKNYLYQIPSFLRIYKAIKKGIVSGGLDFSDNYNY